MGDIIDNTHLFGQDNPEDAGNSEPVNDPGAHDETAQDTEPQPEAPEGEQAEIAYAVTVFMTTDGQIGVEPSGEITLGDMQALLYRALKGAEAKQYAEATMFHLQMAQQQAQKRSGIVTPKPRA